MRMVGALQDSCNVKFENIALKQRLIELEKQLDLPQSFDPEVLQEQLQQQHAQAQQLPWLMQQCVPAEQQQPQLEGPPGQEADAAAAAAGDGAAVLAAARGQERQQQAAAGVAMARRCHSKARSVRQRRPARLLQLLAAASKGQRGWVERKRQVVLALLLAA